MDLFFAQPVPRCSFLYLKSRNTFPCIIYSSSPSSRWQNFRKNPSSLHRRDPRREHVDANSQSFPAFEDHTRTSGLLFRPDQLPVGQPFSFTAANGFYSSGCCAIFSLHRYTFYLFKCKDEISEFIFIILFPFFFFFYT